MNGISVVADTNIIVYMLNGNKRIAEWLNGKEVYLSFVTELELFGKWGRVGVSSVSKYSHH